MFRNCAHTIYRATSLLAFLPFLSLADSVAQQLQLPFFITAQFMGMSHTVLLPSSWIVLIDRRRDKQPSC
jgi:hypothetical protein